MNNSNIIIGRPTSIQLETKLNRNIINRHNKKKRTIGKFPLHNENIDDYFKDLEFLN